MIDWEGSGNFMTISSGAPVTYVNVTDRQRSLDFYGTVLGLEVRDSDEYGAHLRLGPALLRLTVIPDHKAHDHPVLGWEVEDFDTAARDLLDRGVKFTIYDGFGQDELGVFSSEDGQTRMAWFPDPDGNMLMLSKG
jgi:catechol 2,3-dioxygenase-like lactoylglutathione lyase family enzyme